MARVPVTYECGPVVCDRSYRGVTARLTLYGDTRAWTVCGWTCACTAHGFTSQAFTTEQLLRDARALWRHHVRRDCALPDTGRPVRPRKSEKTER